MVGLIKSGSSNH